MKKLMYLFVASGLFIITACGTSESKKVDNPMFCHNTGEICLSDHSCCVTKAVAEEADAEEAHTH